MPSLTMGWFITHFVMWQGREWAWGWGYCWARSPSLPQSYILLIGLAEDKHDLSVTVHDCSHKKTQGLWVLLLSFWGSMEKNVLWG